MADLNFAVADFGRVMGMPSLALDAQGSASLKIGDALWWQGGVAMWTPQENRVGDDEATRRGLKCGVDYDIQIPRRGYSGVSQPTPEETRKR